MYPPSTPFEDAPPGASPGALGGRKTGEPRLSDFLCRKASLKASEDRPAASLLRERAGEGPEVQRRQVVREVLREALQASKPVAMLARTPALPLPALGGSTPWPPAVPWTHRESSRAATFTFPGPSEESCMAEDLGQKCSPSSSSSSRSDHSSETSLLQVPEDKHPEEISLLRLQTKDGQRPEWTFYPRLSSNIHTYHVGKQCFFNGVFKGNRRSLLERSVDKSLGKKKYDIDPRNGIPQLTPGDNPYMSPEQSRGFFKAGATLPPVNFSLEPFEKKFDTFIPLEPIPQVSNLPFWEKEKARTLKNEIQEVRELDDWQPAPPLITILFSGVGSLLRKS
uniref:spermatogenesis-associated serine-rich protein 1 n=1 Tax=Jaculus jaculus TaxID=51337 RepID=UPI001E1B081B|nr:spermatogenesis-associated serine-rich protein 1 [Jaculus jaculus]